MATAILARIAQEKCPFTASVSISRWGLNYEIIPASVCDVTAAPELLAIVLTDVGDVVSHYSA